MPEDKKNQGLGMIGSLGGIVVVVLSSFVFVGSYKTDVDTLKKSTEKIDAQNQIQEQRITKLETCYDNVREMLVEMKSDIKDIKKLAQEKQ